MAKRMHRRNPKSKHRRNPKHRRFRMNEGTPKARKTLSAEAKAARKAKSAATRASKQDKILAALIGAGLDPAALGFGPKKPKRTQEEKDAAAANRRLAAELKAERKLIRDLIKAGVEITPEQREKIARKPSGKPRKPREAKPGTAGYERRIRQLAAEQLLTSGAFEGSEDSYGPLEISYVSKKGKNKGLQVKKTLLSARGMAANKLSRTKRKPSMAIARAWRAAQKAKGMAVSAEDRLMLRAMGLAGVPNPGIGAMMTDIGTLLPQMGVSAASLAASAWIGQVAGDKLFKDKQDTMLAKAAPSAVSAAIGLAGYMMARRSKAMAKFAPAILFGGVAAAVVHAIARVSVGGETVGKKLGLPIGIGEYAAMAGMGEYAAMAGGVGEYAAMAGGTGYAGERGIFAGLDDVDPVLSGTDDEDEISYTETLEDEGVNADEGSLNGSIFD